MTGPDPFAGLKGFQRDTAAHVDRMLFEEGRTRFLVADEVGLGKTLVARGVIARALQRFEADGVQRVDIVYISSNAEIGRQNVRRLVPEGYEVFDRLDRLTLLPLHLSDLSAEDRPNFIAFTPGTLPDSSMRTGLAKERALIYVLLAQAWGLQTRKGPIRLLMHPVRIEANFRDDISYMRSQRLDPGVTLRFLSLIDKDPAGLREEFEALASRVSHGSHLIASEAERRLHLVARLRLLLAKACVEALEPDLVVLDEFQRFRHLLEEETEAAQLFRDICEYADTETGQQCKVLLLSATPYRMYTTRDETDDHYSDFVKTLSFLMDRDTAATEQIATLLDDYRREIRDAVDADRIVRCRDALAERLRTVMVRTERLAVTSDRNGMLDAVSRKATSLESDDVRAYVDLDAVLRDAGERPGATGMEYWKSAPYLPNFMEGYVLKMRLHAAATGGPSAELIARLWRSGTGLLPFQSVRDYRAVPATSPRLRSLEGEMLDTGLWRLLWLPPTLNYYELQPPFSDCRELTKRLVFSAWRVAPRAIATLISYEAERRMIRTAERKPLNTQEARPRLNRRLLDFRVTSTQGDRRAAMPVFALIYPSVSLARVDPLELRREWARAGRGVPTLAEAREWAQGQIRGLLAPLSRGDDGPTDERWYWAAPLLLDNQHAAGWLTRPGLADRWAGSSSTAWSDHVKFAADTAIGRLDPPLGRQPDDLVAVLADLALGAPGIASLRALARVLGVHSLTDDRVREAAGQAAWGLRTLLNHPESIALVRGKRRDPFWRLALEYCIQGGLQAVLDEFTHLTYDLGNIGRLDEDRRAGAIAEIIRRVTSMRTGRVVPEEITVEDGRVLFTPHRMRARFARAYGQQDQDDESGGITSAAAVREAFNSPFAPFVLASTSVGQEGLDFHPYCHAVVHWNLPSNPVDLEQREGRVHRYKGHAVRKNVATAIGEASLTRTDPDPWRALFDEAEQSEPALADRDIVPYWVYPGEARIERHVPILPLSRDEDRLSRLLRSLALYRSVLGQPRQEELVELLAGGRLPGGLTFEDLRIDLRPTGE